MTYRRVDIYVAGALRHYSWARTRREARQRAAQFARAYCFTLREVVACFDGRMLTNAKV